MNRSTMAATILGVVLVTSLIGHAQETTSDRLARIEGMSAADKSELRLKLERFERLSADERKRRIDLNESLQAHPEGEQLRQVMHRYYEWLKTISSTERVELQEMPMDERIAKIRQIIDSQERQRFDELTREAWQDIKPRPEDFAKIRTWFDEWLLKHKDEILANEEKLYQEHEWLEERLQNLPPEKKVKAVWLSSFRPGSSGVVQLTPTEADLNELATRLDQETQKRLNDQSADRRRDLLNVLMRNAFISKMHHRASDEDLQKFYRQLPKKRQEALASLPLEEFDKELRREYMKENGGRVFGGRGGPWDDRDGRRGPDGRGPDGRGPGGPPPPGMRDGRDRGPRPDGMDMGPPPFRDGDRGPRPPRRDDDQGPPPPKDESKSTVET